MPGGAREEASGHVVGAPCQAPFLRQNGGCAVGRQPLPAPAELLWATRKECGRNVRSRFQKNSSTHPGLSSPTLVSLSAPHPLSQHFRVQLSLEALSSSLECAFLFPVSIPASSSDITFSLKIGSESYFYPLSRDRPSQTPTGWSNEFKTNPEEERGKGLG